MKRQLISALFATTVLVGAASGIRAQAADSAIHIVADSIGGTVTSAKGPEAGVWVIAETKDLPNTFVKIVVTDDKGRYALPQLPKGKYKVWVRGYGLVDSDPVDATPGKLGRPDRQDRSVGQGRRAILPAELLVRPAASAGGERVPRHGNRR